MTDHRAGRVRSEAARSAILAATAKIFATSGYESLTMEGIAAEASVAKQTIYRWWRSKGALVAECLLDGQLIPNDLTPPDSGDIRRDLAEWLRGIEALTAGQGGDDLVRSLITAAAENEEIGRRLEQSFGADELLIARLDAAVAAGELSSDAPLVEMAQALLGAVIVRVLSRAAAPDDGFSDRLVSVALGTRVM